MRKDKDPSYENAFTLSDGVKTLFVLDGINKPVEDSELDGIIFTLFKEEILDFTYHFWFDPYPYSPQLHEDLDGLAGAGYIEIGSPVKVTKQGKSWVKEIMKEKPELKEVYQRVSEKVSALLDMSRIERFHFAFKLAVQH